MNIIIRRTTRIVPVLSNLSKQTKNRNWTIINIPTILTKSMTTKSNNLPPHTADLCDAYITSPQRLCIVEPCIFQSFGKLKSFYGPIETIRCFESNPLVRETLGEPGNDRVLVVDGGGSKRCAILGKMILLLVCNLCYVLLLVILKK